MALEGTLCSIRDIYRSIRNFETEFQKQHALSLNEGMLLCSLKDKTYSSGEIADILGLTNSNASKVIKSVEDKGYVKRTPGDGDKRQMYFCITQVGIDKLKEIKCEDAKMNDVLVQILNIQRV